MNTNRRGSATILSVDESPCVRSGLAFWISEHPTLSVCGELGNSSEAVSFVASFRPAMVILDLGIGGGMGIELIEQIRDLDVGSKVLVFSRYNEHLYVERALHAGALGWIDKRAGSDSVIRAIERVLDGKVSVSEEMANLMLAQAVGASRRVESNPIARLSNRELEVFGLIGQGLSARVISSQLRLSIHTVHTHRENIKRKLSCASGVELVQAAVRWHVQDNVT